MSNANYVIVNDENGPDTSHTAQSASVVVPLTAMQALTNAQTVTLVDALVEVSRDPADYVTFDSALLAVVRKLNSEHESHVTAETVKSCITDARHRLRVMRGAHTAYNRRLAAYDEQIAAETAPFQKKKTRRNLLEIEKIISSHTKPSPPVELPLDHDYERAIVANNVIRERIRVRRSARVKADRANRPQSTLTVASSADEQKSDEHADTTVETAVLNGKKITKQIRGNLKNISRDGLADVTSNLDESKQQFNKLLDAISEVKSNSARQAAAAEQHVQLLAETVQILKENKQENKESLEQNQPKRRHY